MAKENNNINKPDNGFKNNVNKPNNKVENQFPDTGNFSASSMPSTDISNSPNSSMLPRRPSNNGLTNQNHNPFNKRSSSSMPKNGYNKGNLQNNMKNQAIKEGAKVAANAAAGPVGGAAVEALSKTKVGQKAMDSVSEMASNPLKKMSPLGMFLGGKKKKKNEEEVSGTGEGSISMDTIKRFIIPFLAGTGGCSGCMMIMIITVMVVVIMSPLFYIGELIGQASSAVSMFGEKLGNFLTFRGWCTDTECDEKEKNNFYDKVKEVYDEYKDPNGKYKVTLNSQLLVATLTYSDPQITIDNIKIDENGNIEEPKSNLINFKKGEKKVKDLAKNMVTECCYENGEEYECPVYPETKVTCPADVINKETGEVEKHYEKRWKLDVERYRSYLEDKFIRKYYYDDKQSEEVDSKVKRTIVEIFQRVDFYNFIVDGSSGKGYTKVYGFCSGITVTNGDGSIKGVYDLEEYVAGVVSGESYSGQGIEAYKAQAIAARTYALIQTNNCSTTIESSQRNQVFDENIRDEAREATEATAGLVLLYEDKIFSTQYDSYCYNDSDCTYGTENGKYYVIYKRLPDEEPHKVYLSTSYANMINGGHGRGMSQVASYEMAANGSTYEEILKFFYSDGVQISQMITTISGEFVSTSGIVSGVDDLRVRSDLYAQLGEGFINGQAVDLSIIYSKTAGNLGQCVWYAKSRALELIFHSNMSEADKLKAYNAILATYQNGEGWFAASTLDVFEKSTDYMQPRAGAIISWSSSISAGAKHNYGHVAIIESVDEANQTVVMSEGWNDGGANGAASWSNVRYQSKTMSFSELRSYGKGYTFNGFVYILG